MLERRERLLSRSIPGGRPETLNRYCKYIETHGENYRAESKPHPSPHMKAVRNVRLCLTILRRVIGD
jgi:hypothetical protein